MGVTEHVREIYERRPRLPNPEAERASKRLQDLEAVMHHRLLWKGWPCLSDGFLAAMLRGAKDYLQGLEEARGIIAKDEERDKHLMIIMLLFASVRTDLNANLFADEHDLSDEEKENLKLQWRDLGFPIEIREKLRKVLREHD